MVNHSIAAAAEAVMLLDFGAIIAAQQFMASITGRKVFLVSLFR
jgi:hypothetical protein